MIYHDLPWFTMIYHDLPWFTMIYLWKLMVFQCFSSPCEVPRERAAPGPPGPPWACGERRSGVLGPLSEDGYPTERRWVEPGAPHGGYNPYANHGAGIFTIIYLQNWLILLGQMLANIAYMEYIWVMDNYHLQIWNSSFTVHRIRYGMVTWHFFEALFGPTDRCQSHFECLTAHVFDFQCTDMYRMYYPLVN